LKKTTIAYTLSNKHKTKQQILNWCNQFNICCFFDNNNYNNQYNSFDCLVGVSKSSKVIESNTIAELQQILIQKNNWYFGHISYDFKNQLYPLASNHQDGINFPDFFLFEPEIVVKLTNDVLFIESNSTDCDAIFKTINNIELGTSEQITNLNIQPKISREEYITIINKLKHHIQIGDCYEINFCQEFFAENATINPLYIYQKLNAISPTPFSAYYKLNDKFLLCASPERFIKKVGNKIISQPIKGTAKRNLTNAAEDENLKNDLQQSQKEKSENVMIVDLVRNDLSKICIAGTVEVEELMKIYSFKQVHQMISTVVGELKSKTNFYDVLKALFPMGSMTGAPKLKVMQLIELYEKSNRNIYSGTIGYITPNGDFDFNVVIRSIAYNASNKYLSYQVGGAITHYSNPQQEYDECLLKASAIEKVLKNV
jgi:para-aminobenzoate synthetase component 1